jgi:hypothetical protein
MEQLCPQPDYRAGKLNEVREMRDGEVRGKKTANILRMYLVAACVCFISLFCLLSCGLEAFYYIDYIQQTNRYSESTAVIQLPSTNDLGYGREGNYFENFIIFYRIYISDTNRSPMDADSSSQVRNEINPSLNSEYNAILPSTDITSTTVNTANLENTFFNRGYFMATLAEEAPAIERVLGSGSLGKTLEIFFDTRNGIGPTLSLDGGVTTYTLRRGESGPSVKFNPRPDSRDLYRSFLNHPDLYNKENVKPEINRDVANNSKAQTSLRYTYVSMYIAAAGKSLEMPPRTIYSQPTFVGIFRLTDYS